MRRSIPSLLRTLLLSAFAVTVFSGCGLIGAALQLPGVLMKGVGKALGMASGAAADSSPVLLNATFEIDSREIGAVVPTRVDADTPLR